MAAIRWRGSAVFVLAAAVIALSGCTSFKMPRIDLPPPGTGAPTIGPMGAKTLRSAPVRGANARFAFVRIAGPPADIMLSMANNLSAEAQARRLTTVPSGDPSATYLVRGYLSAVGDRSGTFLVYVWDVVDRNGVRLHRVSGQEAGNGTSSDPWAGITGDTVRAAARRTIDDLVAWAGSA